MTNLQRRLRKLEAGIVDSHGLIPNTRAWLDYWSDKLDRMVTGEEVDLAGVYKIAEDSCDQHPRLLAVGWSHASQK